MGETILAVLEWYLRIGAAVAVVFAVIVGRLEPSAKGGSILFRVLIVPGATLLWPLIVVRTLRSLTRAPKETTP